MPFVFVFSPSLLQVAKGFTVYDFIVTFSGCGLGITVLAAALSKYLLVEMKRWEQAVFTLGARLMVIPGLISTLLGALVALPVLWRQVAAWQAGRLATRAAA